MSYILAIKLFFHLILKPLLVFIHRFAKNSGFNCCDGRDWVQLVSRGPNVILIKNLDCILCVVRIFKIYRNIEKCLEINFSRTIFCSRVHTRSDMVKILLRSYLERTMVGVMGMMKLGMRDVNHFVGFWVFGTGWSCFLAVALILLGVFDVFSVLIVTIGNAILRRRSRLAIAFFLLIRVLI